MCACGRIEQCVVRIAFENTASLKNQMEEMKKFLETEATDILKVYTEVHGETRHIKTRPGVIKEQLSGHGLAVPGWGGLPHEQKQGYFFVILDHGWFSSA